MANRNLVRHHGERGAHGPGGGTLYAGIPMELARDGGLSHIARSVALYVAAAAPTSSPPWTP